MPSLPTTCAVKVALNFVAPLACLEAPLLFFFSTDFCIETSILKLLCAFGL